MNVTFRNQTDSRCRAFTMIEIAIALAVIGFALVAVIGVLPTGLTVQKQTREETIINQDGPYFLEVIRSGPRGMDHLVDNVDWIGVVTGDEEIGFQTNDLYFSQLIPTGSNIVGLLSLPYGREFAPSGGREVSSVVARVRALSGAAVEVGSAGNDFPFTYQVTTEIIPVDWKTNALFVKEVVAAEISTNHFQAYTNALAANVYEVRVTCQWPLLGGGRPGPNRKVFRTLISGSFEHRDDLSFFVPHNFRKP